MEIPRPKPVGDLAVARQLRSILFSEPILGATSVRPHGYLKGILLTILFGWWGPVLARKATDPLSPTIHYLAVTPADIRLFSKPPLRDAFEIGRWKRGSYRAVIADGAATLRLELQVDRLGRVTLYAPRGSRQVLDLVVEGGRGPTALI